MRIRFEEEQKKERRRKIIREILIYLVEIAVVILFAWLIVHFTMKRAGMIGSSMESTLVNGEDVMVNKISYLLWGPSRESVIAFYPEQEEEDSEELDDSSILIRRVVGLPGEKILIKEGKVYVDGELLEENYAFEDMESGGRASSEITLGDDEYFVLGDNRNDMDDSRNDSFTVVKKDNIIGKVILALNPVSMIGGPDENKGTDSTEKQ